MAFPAHDFPHTPAEAAPFLDRPLRIFWKDGKWRGEFVEGKATAEDRQAIKKLLVSYELDNGVAFYGDGAHAVGEEWVVDQVDFMGMRSTKGQVRHKILEVKREQGLKCVVGESHFDITGEPIIPPLNGAKRTIHCVGVSTATRTLYSFVYLDVDFKGKSEFTDVVEGENGSTTELKVDISIDVSSRVTMVK